jgi:hypothetical protein
MANKIAGGSSTAGIANVDANYNLRTTSPQVTTPAGVSEVPYVGAVRMFSENDPGTKTGVAYLKSPETSTDYRLRVGIDTMLFDDSFNGTAQNTSLWKFQAGTAAMAATQSSGFLTLNSGNVATAAASCAMQTWRTFPLVGASALYVEIIGNINASPVANQILETGLFFNSASGTPTAPTDGVFFRLTNASLFGIANYNGVETSITLIANSATIPLATNSKYTMVVSDKEVEFWIDDVLYGELAVASGNASPFLTDSLPVSLQVRNSALVTGGTMLPRIGNVSVSLGDVGSSKPWAHQMTGMGRHIGQTQNSTAVSTPTAIVGASLTTPNSATAAAAALVNISATAQFTGLGGVFQVLPTLTAGTDGILCSYQNPIGSVNQTPREMYITGVSISSAVVVALTGGPLVNAYTLAYGSTAASLATVETASFATGTTKLSRRVPLGINACIAAAVAGTQMNDIVRKFDSPIVVNPGEFLEVTLRNLGVVTTLGSIALTVTFDGYFA